MNIILFFVSVIGQLFIMRIHRKCLERALISPSLLTKIGTASSFTIFLISFFSKSTFGIVLIVLSCILNLLLVQIFEQRQLQQLRSLFPILIDAWILNLRLGLAESAAREKALDEIHPDFAKMLRTTLFGHFSSQKNSIISPLISQELESIKNSRHSALPRLENLRANLKRSAEFRRRSGQAIRQTQIQASLMMLLLIAISFLAIRRYGWSQVGDLVGLALILSSLGLLSIQFLTRKRHWKI